MDLNSHAKRLGEAGDLATDIAKADDADGLAFEFFGGIFAQVFAGVEIAARGSLMQGFNIKVGQRLEQGLHDHLRRGPAVKTRRVHQGRDTAISVAATPGF